MRVLASLLIVLLLISHALPQVIQPTPTDDDCICKPDDAVCSCTLVIDHRLTMILAKEKELIFPQEGTLRFRNGTILSEEQASRVITADGQGSRLVIAINGIFPGPRIEVYDGQTLNVTVINEMHTDSVTVHFHGLHQKGSPWMDGVAFVTQCPILPGQSFVYRFTAFPPGTAFYHAHIGDQRSMGLYGALIVRPKTNVRGNDEIIVTLQDWNHLMDPETAYRRMITEQFDFKTGSKIPTTYSIDKGLFSRYEFQSGILNGKGRYWNTSSSHNGAPLERFKIKNGRLYRFRIIGAMTLYPMRVYIPGQRLTLRGSDAFDLEQIPVQSIIIHPGERYDFLWQAPGEPTSASTFLIAESIETSASLEHNKYHAAEAVLEYVEYQGGAASPNPVNDKIENCTTPCVTFNCPYKNYTKASNRVCLHYDDVKNNDDIRNPDSITGPRVDEEHFFNFAFPGPKGKTPGSVNGREFVPPTSSLLTQPTEVTAPCDESKCTTEGICKCTYIQRINSDKIIQMVFLNLGTGSGWSHPIHLHGHSFYLMKMGLGTYDTNTGALLENNQDINCTDPYGYCSTAAWMNSSWSGGLVPGLSDDPPEKDTVIVPTGGYVVIRFMSDNPGMWFLHCHIDLHNTNGMGMIINEGTQKPPTPVGFPVCRNFLYNGDAGPVINGATAITGWLYTRVIVVMLGITRALVAIGRMI